MVFDFSSYIHVAFWWNAVDSKKGFKWQLFCNKMLGCKFRSRNCLNGGLSLLTKSFLTLPDRRISGKFLQCWKPCVRIAEKVNILFSWCFRCLSWFPSSCLCTSFSGVNTWLMMTWKRIKRFSKPSLKELFRKSMWVLVPVSVKTWWDFCQSFLCFMAYVIE